MPRNIFLFVFFFLFSLFMVFSQEEKNKTVVGYLPEYRLFSSQKFSTHEALDPGDLYLSPSKSIALTPYNTSALNRRVQSPHHLNELYPEQVMIKKIDRLNYFKVTPKPSDGTVSSEFLDQKDHLVLEWFQSLKDVEIFLSVYGDDQHFTPILSDEDKRRTFIYHIYKLYADYNFAGIDIDWEYPQRKKEQELLKTFISELKAYHEHQVPKLSLAINPNLTTSKEVLKSVDYINAMTYDFPAEHATYLATKETINDLIFRYNLDPASIFLGLPLYARIYDLESDNYWYDAKSYREITELAQEKLAVLNTDKVEGYYFNGPKTIKKKLDLVKELDLAGVMIWELGQDSSNPSTSLLYLIDKELH